MRKWPTQPGETRPSRERDALALWASRVAESVEASDFDDVSVVDATCAPSDSSVAAVQAVACSCESRGWRVFDLSDPGWQTRCASRRSRCSTVAIVAADSSRQWHGLALAGLSVPLLLAVVVVVRSGLELADGDGTELLARYPSPTDDAALAAEPTAGYGSEPRRSPAGPAALHCRVRAGWHARRGNLRTAAAQFHLAAEASFARGMWREAVRASRLAMEAHVSGLQPHDGFETALLCARAHLEIGDPRRALQIATAVHAAGSHDRTAATVRDAACLILAETMELRGSLAVARGWLRRCRPASSSGRSEAMAMRLAVAEQDLGEASRVANAVARDDRSGPGRAEALATAAWVYAGLGAKEGCRETLQRAAQMARRTKNAGERAYVAALHHAIGGGVTGLRRRAQPSGLGREPKVRLSARVRVLLGRIRATAHARPLERQSRADPNQSEWEPIVVNEVVALLRLCGRQEDEGELLEHACRYLRDLWRATSVGIWLRDSWDVPAAAAGRCLLRPALAERLCGLEWPIGPESDDGAGDRERCARGGEPETPTPSHTSFAAGAAVRYAGTVEGVLVARWVAEPVVAPDRVRAVLAAGAAALGPAVAALADRQRAPAAQPTESLGLLGSSPPMLALREHVRRASASPFPVLVVGESGSGKELVARAIHESGARRARRFCAVNCAALTDELFDAELFGHARGAFTGAVHERRGLFEEADGGSLFLDEVGELSLRGQAKLLRVLQEREVRRLGENVARRVDVRVIAATNRDLSAAVSEGAFRLDLLYRLDVIRVEVPPLRSRNGDIALLAHEFWRQAVSRLSTKATLSADVAAVLARYHWPGNVRELQNVMMALAVSAPPRGRVTVKYLPAALAGAAVTEGLLPLAVARRSFDHAYVHRALQAAGGSRSGAARLLGITRQGLAKLLARHAPPRASSTSAATTTSTEEPA